VSKSFQSPGRPFALVVGGALCAGLVGGVVSPVWAAETSPSAGQSPIVGGFGLGDALEAMVEERDGALTFKVPVAGLALTWDSRSAGVDRVGFGAGWGLGLAHVTTEGGVRVNPTSGGSFELDATHHTGLRGYGTHDVKFRAVAGQLPPREGTSGEPVEYAYELHELGGSITYFDDAGDPVALVSATGLRTDWVFDNAEPRRLVAVIDGDGVRTELDWESEPGTVVIRSGANLGAGTQEWRVQIASSGLTVTDPVEQVTQIAQAASGLVSRLTGVSGATTEVTWHPADDGVPRVAEIRTVDDRSSTELSVRRWGAGGASPTGWPARDAAAGAPAGPYATTLTDGATRVVSSYDASHLLTGRRTETSSGAGASTVQELAFSYPELPGTRPEQLPPSYNRPVTTELIHHDLTGQQRSVTEGFVFDDLGRVTQRTAADGSVTETVYDDELPVEAAAGGSAPQVPVGLPVRTRTTAADGLVTETRSELNEARTAVIAEETLTGPAVEQLVRTARTEYTVESDGFVSEKRAFPQSGAGEPLVARFERTVDLTAGTVATATTVAAGTAAEAHSAEVTSLVHGQVLEQTDVAGVTTTASYDAAGRVKSQTDALGNTTTIAYETAAAHGRNATHASAPAAEGAAAKISTEERDALGRVVRVSDNLRQGAPVDGHTRVAETREYRGASTVAITDAWGATTVSTKDALDRVVSVVAPNGLTEVTEYDDIAGTKTTGVTATGDLADAELVGTVTTDVNGRTTATSGTRADGVGVPGTSSEYDGLGRTTRTSTASATTTIERDAFGNPAVTTITPTATGVGTDAEPAAASTDETITAERVFDEFGASRQKTLTDAGESRTGRRVTSDELGRTLTEIDQHQQTTAYTYSADGLVTSISYADGSVTTNTYDADTRQLLRTQTEHPDRPTVASATEYDRVTGQPTKVYDPANPAGTTIRYTHDGFGNLTEVVYPDGSTVAHEYDDHGRRLATTDVAGTTTVFGYTKAGLLASAVQRDAQGEELADVAYTYDGLGRVTDVLRGNGVTTRIEYTSASEIASEATTRADGRPESARAYSYDGEGRLVQRTDALHPDDGGVPTATTTAYTYDVHNRLRSSTVHDGATVDATASSRTDYDVNVSGDITEETVTLRPGSSDAAATTRQFAYELTGELSAITTIAPDGAATTTTQTYDDAGNLTHAADGTVYGYDALNRPVAETTPDGTSIATSYWVDGTRAGRQTTTTDGAASATGFYWDGSSLINDTHTIDGAVTGTGSYLFGATREARTTVADGGDGGDETVTATTSYFTSDRHGNVVATTDREGAVTTRYAYSDYGVTNETALTDVNTPVVPGSDCGLGRNPFQFAGEYTDCTGTQHLHARTFDPVTARFTTLDPTALHNRYAFADANPVMNVDPSGHISVADIVNYSIIGATVLFAAFTLGTFALAVASGGSSLALTGAAAAAAGKTATALSWVSAVGLAADGVGAITATLLVVNDHMPDFGKESFLPTDVRDGLTYLDYGLAGGGFVGALATVPALAKAVGARMAPKGPRAGVGTGTPVPVAYGTHPELYDEVADEFSEYLAARLNSLTVLNASPVWEQHFLFDSSRLDMQGMTPLASRLTNEVGAPLGQLSRDFRNLGKPQQTGAWIAQNENQIRAIENSVADIRAELLAEVKLYPGEMQPQYTQQVSDSLFDVQRRNESWAPKFEKIFPTQSPLQGDL
jgi:RHS repeat-associated protein